MAKDKAQTAVNQPAEARYTKAQLLSSKALKLPRDVVSAVLADGKTYTKDQALRLVSDFLERKV